MCYIGFGRGQTRCDLNNINFFQENLCKSNLLAPPMYFK